MRFCLMRSNIRYLQAVRIIDTATTTFLKPFLHSHSLHTDPDPKKPFIPSPSTRNAQLQQLIYAKSKVGFDKLDDALFVFKKMLKIKHLLPVMKFAQLLAALVRMKEHSVAISMFREMRVLSIPINVVTFTTIINCCCHLDIILDYAFWLLGGMIKRGLVPDVVTYNTPIKGLLSHDRPVEAEHLCKKLILFNEVQPSVVTFTPIIDGLCKTSNTPMAVELFRNMEKKGCIPNIVTYTTIIDYLCKDQHVDQAMSLFSEMSHKGIVPDVVTYNRLIQGLCNLNHWEDTIRLLGEMSTGNVSPDVHTFNILIDARGKEGKVKDAVCLMELMIQRGLYPYVVAYSSLMDGYCLHGDIDEALEVLKTMRVNGILPDTLTYNNLQYYFARCISDLYMYTILIDGLSKGGHLQKARSLFDSLPSKGLRPAIRTYNTMIRAFCHEGLLNEASELFARMKDSDCLLDEVAYNILICGYLNKKEYNKAIILFDEMRARSFPADADAVTACVAELA